MNPLLSSLIPDARLQSANYALLNQGTLWPSVPAAFPVLPGMEIVDGLIAANHFMFFPEEKTFMGLVGKTADEDVLAILGTHTNLQWWLDCQARPRNWTTVDGVSGIVESGFSEVYEGMTLRGSGTPLRDWVERQRAGRRALRIVVHSLGAAVGGLVAADAWLPRLRFFAMPKWSDITLSKHVAGKMTPDSVVARNVQDVVPMAPPFAKYQSVLPEAWFNSDLMAIPGDDASRHNMEFCYLPACQLAAAA